VGHVRKLNEDSLLVIDATPATGSAKLSVGAFAVADGVGGHAAGDVASQLTVEAISRFGDDLRRAVETGQPPDTEAWLARAAKAANQAVYAERGAASNDMGSTLVMALVVGRAATVLNVGDSRAYRLRPQGIRQISTDHSLVQRLIEIGQLTPEEARRHPQKSVIYRVIGDSADLAMDLFDVVLSPGEAMLLCSDGLSDLVLDDVIWRAWRDASSPQVACDQLVALAKEGGGYDNITVVIVQLANATP
jgi:serine/threonine protein phosphatase PrpC